MWKDKRVLVTGGNGMIGRELVDKLLDRGANVYIADKKPLTNVFTKPIGERIISGYINADLTEYKNCREITSKKDYVFHLAGVKGNPEVTNERPVDFMRMLQFDTNMIYASQENNVKKFLYTSSIAVEFPETDRFPAHAKKTAETLIEAMRIQYPKETEFCIVRPSSVYGRYDDFNNPKMFVSRMIKQSLESEVLDVWGDGHQKRDFINAKDVADGMIKTMEEMPKEPINLCSGFGTEIGDVIAMLLVSKKTMCKSVKYDTTKPIGVDSKILIANYGKVGHFNRIRLSDGINEVIDYATKSKFK